LLPVAEGGQDRWSYSSAPGLRVSGGVAGDRKAKSVLGFTAELLWKLRCKRPTHRDRPPPKL